MRVFLILIVFLSHFAFGQNCSNDSLFIRFRNDIQIELQRNHNRVIWDDETKESYYTLMIACPIESLAKYVEDSVPAICCLIFNGLAHKNADNDFLKEIVNKHKNDTAIYINSPTDVVVTWSVLGYMEFILKMKLEKKIPDSTISYEFLLEDLQDRIRKTTRIIVPQEHHGMIAKDALLLADSLTCSLEGCKVISFSLSNTNKTLVTKNIFTREIKDFIRDMKSGDRIFIEDIMVELPDKSRRQCTTKVLNIE